MTSQANSNVSSSSRKPQYLQINQNATYHDYRADAAWMAARIDDDVIYDGSIAYSPYSFFSEFKKGESGFYTEWKGGLFAGKFRDDINDPLDWWHDVLMHESFRGIVVKFKTRFNSPYGRRLVPRRIDEIARPEENDWTIALFVDCSIPPPVINQIDVCFSLGSKSDYGRISSPPFDSDEYERICECYDGFIRVQYSLGVVFACDTPHANAIDEATGEPVSLLASVHLRDTSEDEYPSVYRVNNRIVFRGRVLEPQVKNGKMRYVLVFHGDLSDILDIQRWFHDNAPVGTVAFFRASPDMRLVNLSPEKPPSEWSEKWVYDAQLRIPMKHVYMAERATVLMRMLLAPCLLNKTPIWGTSLVCIKLPVYVLLWIFDWLPEEFGGWREVAKLRCLTGVQSALRRVLQARPDVERTTVSKRTRSAKHQDWV